ncbi:MAG TPA: hypothetical protein VN324_10885, partial [Quisquiliibacterium sp.]|nr:hypothetical protein [Quisquiliibacterium sp.]
PVDYVLLTAYGVFGYLAGTRTGVFAALGATHRRAATWLLPAAALFDAVENALHWWLTEAPRFGVPLAYALSAGFSWLKWMSIVAFLLICARAVARAGN